MRPDLIHRTDSALREAIRALWHGQPQRNETFATARSGGKVQVLDIIWVSAEHRSLL